MSSEDSAQDHGPDPQDSETEFTGIPDQTSGGWRSSYVVTGESFIERRGRFLAVIAFTSIVSGISLEWLQGYGYITRFAQPGITLALSIIIVMMVSCITAFSVVFNVTTRLPEYQEMEEEFKRAKEHFDFEEWEEALEIFNVLLQPDMQHRRALFYSAACYENLNDWEKMKKYIKLYLELQPKDPTAWEMLARAHKRLFEYEEADEALAEAQRIS